MSDSLDVLNNQDQSLCDKNIVQRLKEKVDALYLFRDHYFENHSIDNASQKNSDIENELQSVLNFFENVNVSENRAIIFYLKGRALNVVPAYNKDAEDLLSKAVKLDPKLVEAWNELGEVYWKKDNIEEAKNCFTGALLHGKNKISLRNLSMVLRQTVAKTRDEHKSNVEKGVECAKEAVQLDTNDGLSWAVLGNSYLSTFFNVSQNPQTLKLTMSAYAQAEKDSIARNSADLHYNKAMALKYEEEYDQALDSFSMAHKLDPTWPQPSEKESHLLKYLRNIQELIKQKGKLKGKKLKQMVQSIDSKMLGPYHGGCYSSKGQTVKLEAVQIADLKPGVNTEKVVLGKVVCSVHNEDVVPFTFCLMDSAETVISVTLYNLAEGKGVIIGDSVAIPEPYLTQVRIKYKSLHLNFDSIRVETPVLMVVNGRKNGRDQQASTQLSSCKKTD